MNAAYMLSKPLFGMTREEREATTRFMTEQANRGVVVIWGYHNCAFCGAPLGKGIEKKRQWGEGKPGIIIGLCRSCFAKSESEVIVCG